MENNSANKIKDIINDLYFNLKTISDQSLIDEISKSREIFPMFDIYTKNIILVEEKEIDLIKFNKVSEVLKLDKYFDNLPEKLQTKVGMDGIFLSGGQKQMISLARALYKDTDIMLFDEPSSALDINTKFDIKKIILNLKRKKTLIMVSHDIDYFSECFDKIIEINDSKLKIIK